MPRKSVDLPRYYDGMKDILQRQADDLTSAIPHQGEKGRNDEERFRQWLRRYLPVVFGVDTGFAVRGEKFQYRVDEQGRNIYEKVQVDAPYQSPQMDVLITDLRHNAPLCAEEETNIFPIEMVLAAIEITRDLNRTKLRGDLEKLATLRAIAGVKNYAGSDDGAASLRPMAYIVGLGGSISEDAIEKEIAEIDDDLRPNGILHLDRGYYHREPYTTKVFRIEKAPLFHFAAFLRARLARFPVAPANLSSYVPAVGKPCGGEQENVPGDGL